LNTNHHTQYLSAQQSLDLVPEISSKLDEPFADASIIPTYFLSKFTRSHVTVALGGDGSDELMAGYPTFISDYFIDFYRVLPQFIKSIITGGSKLLPVSDKNISLDFKIRQFLQGFEMNKQFTSSLWLGSFVPSEKQKLFSKDSLQCITNGHGLGVVDKYIEEVKDAKYFEKLLYTYYRTYLLDDILFKVDRASMYTSLEVRAPFLDYHLVEFLSGLPKKYKLQGFNGKYVLKELMRDKIPNDIIGRPKKGFGIPLSSWIRKELKPLSEELLSEDALKKHGLFDYSYISKIKNNHYEVKENNRKTLWNLMMFQLWYNEWM
jgi:asparagine synthase (glutamine-hydrolysing)